MDGVRLLARTLSLFNPAALLFLTHLKAVLLPPILLSLEVSCTFPESVFSPFFLQPFFAQIVHFES